MCMVLVKGEPTESNRLTFRKKTMVALSPFISLLPKKLEPKSSNTSLLWFVAYKPQS